MSGGPAGEAPILEARALERRFETRRPLFGPPTVLRAVDGVDLAVRRGETLAIVGESGCGKSTLARLLVGLIEPSAGEVLFEGRPVAGADPSGGARGLRALRRELQFIFQDPFASLNPRMTVGALVGEPLLVHGIGTRADRDRAVAALLARVGLRPEHAHRYPHEFSGGQRQRIGIARALASGPRVLVGDEPVSALDVSIQAQVVNILEDLKAELGLTLVVIAHDLAVIRHMADRVAVMYLGRIVEIGPVGAIFARPLHPYAEALLAAIPVPAASGRGRARVTLEGDPPNPIAPPPGCRFHTRCPHAAPVCAEAVPPLRDLGADHHAACHFAGELRLEGARTEGLARRDAARRRFARYAEARAAMDAGPPPSGRHPNDTAREEQAP